MTERIVIEPLSRTHDRSTFSCGVAALDRYFREQVTQDIRRRVTNCFVAVALPNKTIVGYYTFAAAGIPTLDLPQEETKRLPRYPLLPAGLIGRLAVDQQFRNRGLGSALLADAAARAMRADPAIFALLVEAKDENALAFYRAHGFSSFASRPMSLFLALATAQSALLRPPLE